LFVKNDDGSRADNVTVVIGGRTFGSFSLTAKETEDLPSDAAKGTLRYKQEQAAKQI